MIFFHPVMNLPQISHHLGAGHQLAVPGFPVIGRRSQKLFRFFLVYKRKDGRGGIAEDFFADPFGQKGFIFGVIGFRIGGFPAVAALIGKFIPTSFPKKRSCHSVSGFHVPGDVPDVFLDPMVCKRHTGFQPGEHAGPVHAV